MIKLFYSEVFIFLLTNFIVFANLNGMSPDTDKKTSISNDSLNASSSITPEPNSLLSLCKEISQHVDDLIKLNKDIDGAGALPSDLALLDQKIQKLLAAHRSLETETANEVILSDDSQSTSPLSEPNSISQELIKLKDLTQQLNLQYGLTHNDHYRQITATIEKIERHILQDPAQNVSTNGSEKCNGCLKMKVSPLAKFILCVGVILFLNQWLVHYS